MGEAFALGLVAASSLVVGAALALVRPLKRRTLGMVMGFGAGVLISGVAYDLVLEAFVASEGEGRVGLGLIAGALTFFAGDMAIDRLGGAGRKDATDGQVEASGQAILLGTVLDGIPESIVLGVGLVAGSAGSAAMLVTVFVSNIPEAMASTADLRSAGWSARRLLVMWAGIAIASGLASAIGFGVFADASEAAIAFVLAYAGGAVLTMLADSMMPEAFADGGRFVGVVTTIGFGVGFLLVAAT